MSARTDVIPYVGSDPVARARAWSSLPDDELRRRVVAACRDHDATALWSLTDAYLTEYGRAGATVSPHTRRNYRQGAHALIAAWTQQNLLHPARNAGIDWLRQLEQGGATGEGDGLKPATVRIYLAAARTFYAALRWAGATTADPFKDARPAPDPTKPWDKRRPYSPEDVTVLRGQAGPLDLVLVLLAGHAGLRVAEILALRWDDVDLDAATVVIRHGKGGKQRHVSLSGSAVAALTDLRRRVAAGEVASTTWTGERAGHVLPTFGTTHEARERMKRLCARAGVPYKGIHALRHAAGTRIVREGGDLERAAQHLGHSSLDTTRVYVKWADEALKQQVGAW